MRHTKFIIFLPQNATAKCEILINTILIVNGLNLPYFISIMISGYCREEQNDFRRKKQSYLSTYPYLNKTRNKCYLYVAVLNLKMMVNFKINQTAEFLIVKVISLRCFQLILKILSLFMNYKRMLLSELKLLIILLLSSLNTMKKYRILL